ncbi:MAG: hypothetical protein KDA89_21350, partial [Planctomycetaceae bacterium]|nr:hypothetical protein [Planctomycetaceae bacterium]
KSVDVVHPGRPNKLQIRWEQFELEDQTTLRQRLPLLTVIRKEKPLTETEAARLRLDKTARRMELAAADACGSGGGCSSGCGADPELYQLQQVRLAEARSEEEAPSDPKSRRTGNPGCCGRGCNGCLVFWHDPAYAKGRELMKQKKIGELLTRNSRS